MSQSHTCQFKVKTVLPDLARRQIKQIEIGLAECRLVNRNGSLVADGIVGREIRCLEPDGRLRRVKDQIQFEVILGVSPAESVAFFQPELKSDYFIMQAAAILGSQPVLEQAFTLTVWWETPIKPVPVSAALQLDRIVDQGKISRIIKFSVTLPATGARPEESTAQLVLDSRWQYPLVTGQLKGRIGYRGGANQSLEFEQTINWLIQELPKPEARKLSVSGAVRDISWIPGDLNNNIWNFTVVVDLQWYLTETRELPCRTECQNSGESLVQVKTHRVLHRQRLECEATFRLAAWASMPDEVKAVLKDQKEVFTKNGLLLTAAITIEAFYQHSVGMEAYQQWTVEFNRLVSESVPPEDRQAITVLANLKVDVKKYTVVAGQLQVDLLLNYELSFLIPQLAGVVGVTESPWSILADVQLGGRRLTVMGETEFRLRSHPLAVHQVVTEISNLVATAKPGWVSLQGQLEVNISYCDRANRQRLDSFNHCFQESIVWEGLQPAVAIEAQAKLEFDSYALQGQQLCYKYLLELALETCRKQELQIAVVESGQPGPVSRAGGWGDGFGVNPFPAFIMEREIALRLGAAREIAANRTSFDWFQCREVGKAFLVEGALDSELEYWDRSGFLRREWLNVPFWRFVQLQSGVYLPAGRMIPRIRQCGYQPLRAWPWQKGSVRLRVEIELCQAEGEDTAGEGTAPKSD